MHNIHWITHQETATWSVFSVYRRAKHLIVTVVLFHPIHHHTALSFQLCPSFHSPLPAVTWRTAALSVILHPHSLHSKTSCKDLRKKEKKMHKLTILMQFSQYKPMCMSHQCNTEFSIITLVSMSDALVDTDNTLLSFFFLSCLLSFFLSVRLVACFLKKRSRTGASCFYLNFFLLVYYLSQFLTILPSVILDIRLWLPHSSLRFKIHSRNGWIPHCCLTS
jgi:hypothetical protein